MIFIIFVILKYRISIFTTLKSFALSLSFLQLRIFTAAQMQDLKIIAMYSKAPNDCLFYIYFVAANFLSFLNLFIQVPMGFCMALNHLS